MPSCFAKSSISCGPTFLPASIMKYSDRVLGATALSSRYKSSNRPLLIILSTRPILLRCRLTCVSLSIWGLFAVGSLGAIERRLGLTFKLGLAARIATTLWVSWPKGVLPPGLNPLLTIEASGAGCWVHRHLRWLLRRPCAPAISGMFKYKTTPEGAPPSDDERMDAVGGTCRLGRSVIGMLSLNRPTAKCDEILQVRDLIFGFFVRDSYGRP